VNNCNKKATSYKLNIKTKETTYFCSSHKKQHDCENNKIYQPIKNSNIDIKHKCCSNNCDKIATIYNLQNYYCSKHKPIDGINAINKYKCVYNIDDENKCNKNAKYYNINDNNLHYCALHKNMLIHNDEDKNMLDTVVKTKINDVEFDEILKKLIIKLDSIPELLNVDAVIIENQPSLINPKMKTISTILYSYFLVRGIIDKKGSVKNVHFTSPSNKLKIDTDNLLLTQNDNIENNSDKYKLTKQLGIKYCKQLIQHDENSIKLLDTLTKNNKADDLCDAMLQGAYYLIKNN
jgi:hypothetical protein